MLFGDLVHGLLGRTLAADHVGAQFALSDLEQLSVFWNVPEVHDEGHGLGEGGVEGRGV